MKNFGKMATRVSVLVVVALVCLFVADPAPADDQISVMTQNQYLGADIMPLLSASDLAEFNAAVVAILRQRAASDFPARVRSIAREVAGREPHLVGLQEVWLLRCFDLAPPIRQRGCDDPSIAGAFGDQLTLTLDALDDEGVTYNDVASVENLDLRKIDVIGVPGLPFVINGTLALLIGMDRDVILARDDILATPAPLPCAKPSADGCNFEVVLNAPTPVGPVPIERGFVAVDTTIDGMTYRFVNTHLEVPIPDPTVQSEQAAELIEALAETPFYTALVVAGDINSDPRDFAIGPFTSPYAQFVDAGYVDSWTFAPATIAGNTCCQLADLSNKKSLLDERIDMIFAFDTPYDVLRPRVLGAAISDKTSPPGQGIWPSDHGGVAVDLLF